MSSSCQSESIATVDEEPVAGLQLTPKKRRNQRSDSTPQKKEHLPHLRESVESRTGIRSLQDRLQSGNSSSPEQSEAAIALTTLAASPLSQQEEPAITAQKRRPGRRVSFAEGPLKGGPADRVTEDGHPNHEGEVALRRRESGATYCEEPITKHAIVIMEAELGGSENSPSLERLKRRFGLAPPIQRDLPYVTCSNPRKRPPPQVIPIFGRTARPIAKGRGPNVQRPMREQQQHRSMPQQKKAGTPEGRNKDSSSSLLELLRPLELINSTKSSMPGSVTLAQ